MLRTTPEYQTTIIPEESISVLTASQTRAQTKTFRVGIWIFFGNAQKCMLEMLLLSVEKKKKQHAERWLCMPLIPVLGRQRQVNL